MTFGPRPFRLSSMFTFAALVGCAAVPGDAEEGSSAEEGTAPALQGEGEVTPKICIPGEPNCGKPQCSTCTRTSACWTTCYTPNGIPSTCGADHACGEGDSDGDGRIDNRDNCPRNRNPGQEDCDIDGIGDVCDSPQVVSFTCKVTETGWLFKDLHRTCFEQKSQCPAPTQQRLYDCGTEYCLFREGARECCLGRGIAASVCDTIGTGVCPTLGGGGGGGGGGCPPSRPKCCDPPDCTPSQCVRQNQECN